jgi:hypothetical protein
MLLKYFGISYWLNKKKVTIQGFQDSVWFFFCQSRFEDDVWLNPAPRILEALPSDRLNFLFQFFHRILSLQNSFK